MSAGKYGDARSLQIYAQLTLSIAVLLILYLISIYDQVSADLLKKVNYLSMSIYTIFIPFLVALFLLISPIDLMIVSIPDLLYSIYIIYSRNNLITKYSFALFGDQIISTLVLIFSFLIVVSRYRATLRPRNFYRDIHFLRNFFTPSFNRESISNILITMGLVMMLLVFLEMIIRTLFNTSQIFLSYWYLLGALISSIFLAKNSRYQVYFAPIAVLSWLSLSLIYVSYSEISIKRKGFARRGFTDSSVVHIDGVVINRGKLYIDLSTRRSPHILIVGATGSGKTQMSKRICDSLSKNNVATIIIDPHNEYVDLGFERYGIHEITGIILSEIAGSRESIEEFIDILRVAFRLGSLQVAVLSDIIQEYFQGYRDLRDLTNFIEKKISESDNSEIQRALRSVQFYIRLLLESIPQDIEYSSRYSIDLNRSMTIDLSYIAKNEFITEVYVYFLLRHIWRKIRERGFSEKIEYYIVLDEAHNLLSGRVSELISRILRESRKFGLGVIIVSQLIDQRIKEFFGNIGSLLIMKTFDRETLDFIESATKISASLASSLREREFLFIDLYREKIFYRGKLLFKEE
ncbi:MAG: helicase HerA domain-containing protein [Sulfolobales archaeon]